jgi:RNA polymerase sigma-70 factor (ECF subfamily)
MTATAPPLEDALIAMLPRLRRYALVLTGALQQADDLVVDTLAYARETQELRQHQTALLTWLFMLMHELHVDESPRPRNGHAGTPRGIEHRPGDQPRIPDAGTRSSRADSAETLDRFSRLPVAQREILLMVVVESLSYGEIATLLGVPIATVMSRLNRARANLTSMTGEPPVSGKVST